MASRILDRVNVRRLTLFFAALLALGGVVHGGSGRPVVAQSTPATTARPIAGLGGTWKGPVEIIPPGGGVAAQRTTGVLWLNPQGSRLSGAIGPDADHLSAIKKAHVTTSGCQFTLTLRNLDVAFDLSLSEGHLKGRGTSSQITVVVDLQPAPDVHPLYEQIAAQDARLFGAYNARDLGTLETMFSPDLEFYHDKDGFKGYRENMDSFKKNFAGPTRMRRELDDETLEIYPVKDFGAMEIGVHRFYSTEPGLPEKLTATAKFVHVWKNTKGMWQITRVMSYDHH